ncbi:MAG: helix-turn-helix domain-containing protein [Lachnotalea sp.]
MYETYEKMYEMYEIFDEYCWTNNKKVITKDKHQVPGLGNFSYWTFTTSSVPSPMHYHSDIIEVHCMIKGKRYTQIEKDGKITKYICTGNQAFLTFPSELHSNGNEPLTPCEFYAFQIIISDPFHMFGLNKEYSYELYNQLMKLEDRHICLGTTHLNFLRSAFNFFGKMEPHSTMIGVQFLTCFLFNLQFLSPVQDKQIYHIDERIKKSIVFLNNNIQESLQLIDLAKESGYSLSRFKVKFKEEVGITPAEYITLQKLEYAKTQLIETNISITDLAYLLGFSSSNYFSSVFKKIMACTPQNYRKRYRLSSKAEKTSNQLFNSTFSRNDTLTNSIFFNTPSIY